MIVTSLQQSSPSFSPVKDLKSLKATIAALSTRTLSGSAGALRAQEEETILSNKLTTMPENIIITNGTNGTTKKELKAPETPSSQPPQESAMAATANKPSTVRFVLPSDSVAVHVTFSPKTRVRVIPSQRDMSTELKNKFWRTEEETKASNEEIVRTVNAVRSASRYRQPFSEDDTRCARGLEKLIPAASLRLKARRAMLTDAVLSAQEEEWEEGNWLAEPEFLRNISKAYSNASVDEAVVRGAKDEAYVCGMRRHKAATAA
mmetsp:Transcript_27425/g.79034  ORF Transcript_27425/g.79034 Transcript_27425/m.79034 type:complete len:262 (-) Transcript_27425:1726-2511(-)|eukprot:CAMPEP_0181036740 /NCGR_PEP_ID=MMETSP1070-20121207/9028_1 /TAXON_ID=265543 /ORGANISM="Minutocellus polymorphus, Strain NH13" /LENGTH=261 /DNA_ID=CAMNT_0023114407 /DNA_START=43 /DNA_END=828 /DNA_ORIENTATION=+